MVCLLYCRIIMLQDDKTVSEFANKQGDQKDSNTVADIFADGIMTKVEKNVEEKRKAPKGTRSSTDINIRRYLFSN